MIGLKQLIGRFWPQRENDDWQVCPTCSGEGWVGRGRRIWRCKGGCHGSGLVRRTPDPLPIRRPPSVLATPLVTFEGAHFDLPPVFVVDEQLPRGGEPHGFFVDELQDWVDLDPGRRDRFRR